MVQRNADIISFLARLDSLQYGDHNQQEGAADQMPGLRIFLPSSGMIDPKAEAERVAKELEKAKNQLRGLEAKLNNPGYLEKAPEALVEQSKQMAEELRKKIAVLEKKNPKSILLSDCMNDIFRVRGGKSLSGTVSVSGSKNAALPILAATVAVSEFLL